MWPTMPPPVKKDKQMTYCTLNDIQTVITETTLIQLTDDVNVGAVDANVVNSAIEYADTLINGYLRPRYTLPLTEVPQLLKNFSIDLARHWLYSRRLLEMPDALKDSYKNTIKFLENLQSGKLTLGIQSATEDERVEGAGFYSTNKTSEDRMFPKSELDKF